MRGKVTNNAVCWQLFRITPAYAGKSTIYKRPEIIAKDHPRLCGEKSVQTKQKLNCAGSPPPMRGKAIILKNFKVKKGITPAYAGKSARVRSSKIWKQDHPRLCGEKKGTAGKAGR